MSLLTLFVRIVPMEKGISCGLLTAGTEIYTQTACRQAGLKMTIQEFF